MSTGCKPWLDTTISANGRSVKDNFADWFSTSKVLDGQGSPLVVFHGTRAPLASFGGGISGNRRGHWFTESSTEADAYAFAASRGHAGARIDVFLRVENPYAPTSEEVKAWRDAVSIDHGFRKIEQSIANKAKRNGHDGVCWPGGYWQVFRPEQIKAADNVGLFLRNSSSLTDHDAAIKLQRVQAARQVSRPSRSAEAKP